MLPIPVLARPTAADSPASPALLLTTKALVGRDPPNGSIASKGCGLKPLSGLKSLNIELSSVWYAGSSTDSTFLTEEPECTSMTSDLVKELSVISSGSVTSEDIVQGFEKLDEGENLAPASQWFASDAFSPILAAKDDLDSSVTHLQHVESPESLYGEDARHAQEKSDPETDTSKEGQLSHQWHETSHLLDRQDGTPVQPLSEQKEPDGWHHTFEAHSDVNDEAFDALPVFSDHGSFRLYDEDLGDEEEMEDSHSLSSILPKWATERRGWMNVLDKGEDCEVREDEPDQEAVARYKTTAPPTPRDGSEEASIVPCTESILKPESSAEASFPDWLPYRDGRQYGSIPSQVALTDRQESRKRQAVESLAAEDGKLMQLVKKVRSSRAAVHRDKMSPIDMFLRMTGKAVPPTRQEELIGEAASRPAEGSRPPPQELDESQELDCDLGLDAVTKLAEDYVPPSSTQHYLVSLRGLQNHLILSHLTSRCNVSLIEAAGLQDDWEWDLILDATSAVILFKLSLLPAAMKVEDRLTGGKTLTTGSEGDLTLKQMLQSERFDAFLVLLEAYSSSGRQIEQTRPLLLAQDALRDFTSHQLGSSKSVTVDVVRSPFEAAVRIRRWGEELQDSAAREDEALRRTGIPATSLTPVKVWESRESWLHGAALEEGQRERYRLQTLGLNVL